MARTSFARTFVITYCDAEWFDSENVLHKGEVKIYGDYDLSSAQGAVKRKLNARGAIVKNVRHESFYGSMSIETFAKYCTKSNRKEW